MNERKDRWSVGEWMSPNPVKVPPDTLARDALMMMRKDHFRHLLVVDGETLQGIVTDRDLRRPNLTAEPDGWNDYYDLSSDYSVFDIMTRELVTVRCRDSVEKALSRMVELKVGCLPVLDKNEKVIGIVTTHDLLLAFQAVMGEVGRKLRGKERTPA